MNRTVSGVLYTMEGEPLRAARVRIRLKPGSYTAEGSYLGGELALTTSPTGLLSVSLWANELGEQASCYEVALPDGERFSFVLPAGIEVLSWSEVRLLGVTEQEPQYQTLVSFIENNPNLRGPGSYDEDAPFTTDLALLYMTTKL